MNQVIEAGLIQVMKKAETKQLALKAKTASERVLKRFETN